MHFFMVFRNVGGDNKCRLVVFKHEFYCGTLAVLIAHACIFKINTVNFSRLLVQV